MFVQQFDPTPKLSIQFTNLVLAYCSFRYSAIHGQQTGKHAAIFKNKKIIRLAGIVMQELLAEFGCKYF